MSRRHARAARMRAPLHRRLHDRRALGCHVRGSTSNGAIELEDVGEVDVQTSNGRIELEDVTGSVVAETSNGRISGSDLSGDGVRATTSNGAIELELGTPQDVEASTSNGAIRPHRARRQLPGLHRDVERPHRRRHPERLRRPIQRSTCAPRTARSPSTRTSRRAGRARAAQLVEHGGELVDGPVEVGRLDHDRRRQPDRRAVRVLREHAAPHERLAHLAPGARSPGRCRCRPRARRRAPSTTPWPTSCPRRSCRCAPSVARALLRLARREHAHDLEADGRGERVAAERRAVLAGLQHAEHVAVADDRGHRHDAAAERLAEQVEVGHDAHELAREGRIRRGRGPTGSRRR